MSYRLLRSVSLGADVVQSIMSDVSGVDRLPGHAHTEGGFLINLQVPHPVTRSWGIRERQATELDIKYHVFSRENVSDTLHDGR